MNTVYNLGARLEHATHWGKETLAGGGLNNKQFDDFVKQGRSQSSSSHPTPSGARAC